MKHLKYLGQIGTRLPELSELEWHYIFEFLEFYTTTENMIKNKDYSSFNWIKIKEILTLLNKIK